MERYSFIGIFLIGFLSGISLHTFYETKYSAQNYSMSGLGVSTTMARDMLGSGDISTTVDSSSITILPTLPTTAESIIKIINEYDVVHGKLIEDYYNLAVSEQKKYGFPASVKLAQMILEGGYSKDNPKGSKLAQEANNPFGIKYFGEGVPERVQKWDELVYSKDYVLAKDDCKGKCRFIKFRGIWHAFRYHSEFMTGVDGFPSHYSKYITTGDWKDWISAIRKGNYATYKYYHIELTNLIEKYKLYQLDEFG